MNVAADEVRHRARDLADTLARRLLERSDGDIWRGRLSSSALATAIAAAALEAVGDGDDSEVIRSAVAWLEKNVNADGGWGDAPDCPSNLSATLIVRAALARLAPDSGSLPPSAAWLDRAAPGLTPDAIASAVIRSYGDDRTFSVPILAFSAAMGVLGPAGAWRRIPQLPCELGLLPQRALAALRIPVVSYALPALIAMGLARHRLTRDRGPAAWLRDALTPALLRRLERIQPAHGGFLEAVPLTGFVVVAIAAAGLRDHPVVRRAAAFLREVRRRDGSWPIDRDLAVWLTAGAARAIATADPAAEIWPAADRRRLRRWLMERQGTSPHPFTGAAPGGWAWTDHPGGVPDADDTSAALLALESLGPPDPAVVAAAGAGLRWLFDLQNRDGGFPTFCRGWGRLPFDRSCPDITAHAIRAAAAWAGLLPPPLQRRARRAIERAVAFLAGAQELDGAWTPLWFGNSAAPGGANPVFGTGQVLRALAAMETNATADSRRRAMQYLTAAQRESGGWGGVPGLDPSIEETAMALAGLAEAGAVAETLHRGLSWLEAAWSAAAPPRPAPIGLYFARLWYAEDLYPLIFSLHAAAALARWQPRPAA